MCINSSETKREAAYRWLDYLPGSYGVPIKASSSAAVRWILQETNLLEQERHVGLVLTDSHLYSLLACEYSRCISVSFDIETLKLEES